jgi:CspA family cold shock protein
MVRMGNNAFARFYKEPFDGQVKLNSSTPRDSVLSFRRRRLDVFVHISAVERAGMHNLNEGQKLSFDVQTDSRSGKAAAANLQAA